MILVTGSTGKAGKELVRKLQEAKANFRVERVTGRKPIPFDQFAREHASAWK